MWRLRGSLTDCLVGLPFPLFSSSRGPLLPQAQLTPAVQLHLVSRSLWALMENTSLVQPHYIATDSLFPSLLFFKTISLNYFLVGSKQTNAVTTDIRACTH